MKWGSHQCRGCSHQFWEENSFAKQELRKNYVRQKLSLEEVSEKRQRQEMPNNRELLCVIFITTCIGVLN